MLVSCEGMFGSAKIELLGLDVKYGVELGDEGRASVMFNAPSAWTARVEFNSREEQENPWMRVEPESGEAGDSLTLNIIGIGNRPIGRTYGGKVRIELTNGSDDTKVIVSWKEAPFVPINVESFTLNPAGPLTLKVNERKVVQIVYSPSNATEINFQVNKPDGTAEFDLLTPFEGARDKFQIIAQRPGKGIINVSYPGGDSKTMEVTVTQ